MSNIKFCKNCRNKNNQDLFFSGYYNWLNDDCYKCPMKDCEHELIDIDLSKEDFDIITSISKDINFLESMIQLKNSDIIEYNLKLSQFKTQVQQQKNIQKQQSEQSKVHCPFCNSVNVKKISGTERVASVAMLGIFSKKINKSFKCNACGGTF